MGRLEKAAWQLNLPLEAGSLFPEGQDIEIVYVVLPPAPCWEVEEIQRSKQKTSAQIVALIFTFGNPFFFFFLNYVPVSLAHPQYSVSGFFSVKPHPLF